jgi:DNA-binding NarL/FixJ family response regulator
MSTGSSVASRVTRTRKIRVMIGDRRRLVAESLAALIGSLDGFTVTGVIGGDDGIPAIGGHRPDVAVVGVGQDQAAAIELVRSLSARAPDLAIVLVAESLEPELVRFVLEQQLSGLLLTDASGRDIGASLDQVAQGRAILPAGWRQALTAERNEALDALSERQLQVLTLLADGCSYEEIAERLFITVNTVKFHVRSIFVRLGVRNRMAAARMLNKATRGASFSRSTADRPARRD